jgi:hypothetical protein
LVERKVGKVIWSTKSGGQDWKMRAELWGDKAFIEKYPEITQIVANAYVKAAHWSSQPANFEAFLQIAVRSGQAENALRQEYADDSVSWKERWSPLPADFVLDHYRNAIAYSREARLIRAELDASSLFDTRFVISALRELRLEGYWSAPAKLAAKVDVEPTMAVFSDTSPQAAPTLGDAACSGQRPTRVGDGSASAAGCIAGASAGDLVHRESTRLVPGADPGIP